MGTTPRCERPEDVGRIAMDLGETAGDVASVEVGSVYTVCVEPTGRREASRRAS